MADWTWTTTHAEYPYTGKRIAPPTLVTRYEDGSEHRRQKHSNFIREWTEVYDVDEATLASMLNFYDARGTYTTFTKVSYDPDDATPGTTEATVRFVEPMTYERVAVGSYRVTVKFTEVL
ncbi:MAG: hypothetical protein Q9Q40_13855 [Acidobacteriota bacterium]|nr:hypothetical protein [Acidobacteriota bacterium]